MYVHSPLRIWFGDECSLVGWRADINQNGGWIPPDPPNFPHLHSNQPPLLLLAEHPGYWMLLLTSGMFQSLGCVVISNLSGASVTRIHCSAQLRGVQVTMLCCYYQAQRCVNNKDTLGSSTPTGCMYLKGQSHEIFHLNFSSWNTSA